MNHAASAAAGMGILFILFWVALMGTLFVFWIMFLIDVIKNEYTGNNKLIWIIVLLGFPPLGVILYQLIGKGQKVGAIKQTEKAQVQQTKKAEVKAPEVDKNIKICECGKEMRIRKKTGGEEAGKKFFVCSTYPACRNIVPVV